MYRCKYFFIRELVPPTAFNIYGDRCWEFFDDRALITLDRIRDKFGPTIVNNWHYGGDRQWSGLRTPISPYYSPMSQHTFGRAFDCLFVKVKPREVIEYILQHKDDPEWEYITAIEDVEDWLHFDVRNCERIKFFKP